MKNQVQKAKKLLESNGYSVLNERDHNHSVNDSTDDYYWSGFGYSVYQRDGKYEVVAGEGDVVYTADTTFDAKKWCKEHKTSSKWAADGKWDWTRESVNKSLPKWQAIEYTKDGPETHVFQTEEEAKEAIKEWRASGSDTKGPTPITRQDNSIDEDQDYRDDSDDDQDFVE